MGAAARNRIKLALSEGRSAFGINVQAYSPELVEMVGLSGYDHVMLDWEHGSFGTDSVVAMIRAAQLTGVTPIVRVPGHDDVHIKRVLDAGAGGIVVPHVSTAEQARRVVASARYADGANGGARGACPSVRAAGHLTRDWQGFVRTTNEETFVAVSVESIAGVQNLPEILAVPGVDALFLGTFDLAHEMGRFGDSGHPEVAEQIDRIIAAAQAAGVPIFATLFLGREPDEVAAERDRWRARGARIFNVMSDRRLITEGLQQRLAVCAG